MKPKLQPGKWVKSKSNGKPKELHVIAHYAAYTTDTESYFVYTFNLKGKYTGAGWAERENITRVKVPKFAEDIIVFPEMLTPLNKHEIESNTFRGGFLHLKKNLVVIDTMLLNSKGLRKWMRAPFIDDDFNSVDDQDMHAGAVLPKGYWNKP